MEAKFLPIASIYASCGQLEAGLASAAATVAGMPQKGHSGERRAASSEAQKRLSGKGRYFERFLELIMLDQRYN